MDEIKVGIGEGVVGGFRPPTTPSPYFPRLSEQL